MSWNFHIHQNHLILNYWSGPYFSPLFHHRKRESINSLWASVPRSLSMFSQAGSISEFRWASCSSHRFCVSVSRTVTQIHAATHIHTQPCMHNTHCTLKHTCYHTFSHKKNLFAPGVPVPHQWVGNLSHQPSQYLTSRFIQSCHQHIYHPFILSPPFLLHPCCLTPPYLPLLHGLANHTQLYYVEKRELAAI